MSSGTDTTPSTNKTTKEDELYHKLRALSSDLRKFDEYYYTGESPVTDAEYDILAKEEERICQLRPDLRWRLEEESGLGVVATRLGRIGAVMGGEETSAKREHLEGCPMMSLDNAYSELDVEHWLKRCDRGFAQRNMTDGGMEVLAEPKLDGLSLSLRYHLAQPEDDSDPYYELMWGATRGDGYKGDDVTDAVLQMTAIPTRFPLPFLLNDAPSQMEIRGEVLLPLNALKDYLDTRTALLKEENSTGDNLLPLFSNARNAAAGILRRSHKHTTEHIQNLRCSLVFYAYDIVLPPHHTLFPHARDMTNTLMNIGFTTPSPNLITSITLNQTDTLSPLYSFYTSLLDNRNRSSIEMDGVVFKLASIPHRLTLKYTNKAPKWSIAYKFPSLLSSSRVLDVVPQVGRTGVITPVAILHPTDIAGVNVTRASLHNYNYAREVLQPDGDRIPKGLRVIVARAGDVIPQVLRRIPSPPPVGEAIDLSPPEVCPACHSPTVITSPHKPSETGKILRCSGSPYRCPPRAVAAMSHAFSKRALDVQGLSDARIGQLLGEGVVTYPADLFRLLLDSDEEARLNATESIADLPGWGPKSTQNLIRALKKVSTVGIPFPKFIYSLGIRHVGIHSSELLAKVYRSPSRFFDAIDAINAQETDGQSEEEDVLEPLREQNGFGPVILSSFVSFAKDSVSVQAARDLADCIHILEEEKTSTDSKPWKGIRVVFTGSIPRYTRTEAQHLAKTVLGAQSTPSGISSKTGVVVKGEAFSQAKIQKALDLGVRVVTAREFLDLVEDYKED